MKNKKTHCRNNHAFPPLDQAKFNSKGTRICVICQKERDRKRRGVAGPRPTVQRRAEPGGRFGEVTTKDVRKAMKEYIKGGNWKCPNSPSGAHYSVNGVCRYCNAYRGDRPLREAIGA